MNNYLQKRVRTEPGSAIYPAFLVITSLVALSGCGGGGSGGLQSGAALAVVETSVGDNSPPADSIADQALQRNAARNAAESLSTNLQGMLSVGGDANTVASSALNSRDILLYDDTGATGRNISPFDDVISETSVNEIDDDVQRFLLAALGVDESGNAQVQREGNRITIDPDDAAVCAGDTFVLDDDESGTNQAQCQQLVSHFTVQLDAVTEQRGKVSFLFDGAPVLVLGYGPVNSWFEVKLGGLHQVMQLAEQLGIEGDEVPAVMQGSVRLTSTAINKTKGLESGSVSLVIPEALLIEGHDGSRMSAASSTVFTATADAAAGTASVEFGLGTFEVLGTFELPGQPDVDPVTVATSKLTLNGLTGRIDLLNNGNKLTVRDFSFGRGPVRFSVDSQMAMELSLDKLGFSFSEQTGELELDTDFALSFIANTGNSANGNLSMSMQANAPSGTRLLSGAQPDQLIVAGGPATVSYSMTSDQASENGLITYGVGTCEDTSNQGQSDLLNGGMLGCGSN